jgi:hypothetical protein
MASKTELPTFRAKYDIADLSVAGVTGLAFALVALFFFVLPTTNIAKTSDFIAFWATGQQLVHHANPYDVDAITRIEYSAGRPVNRSVMLMRNPPWGLPLAFPLGYLSVRVGSLLWSLALLSCLIVSVRILWRMHGRPSAPLHWLGADFSLRSAGVCSVSQFASKTPISGRVITLALRVEASPLSAFRRCAAGMDTALQELQDTGWRGSCHCR